MRIYITALLIATCIASANAYAQITPDMARGLTPYAEYVPSQIDNVNPVNGNLFLKLPLVSFPQKGGKLRLDYYIYYNDKQWSPGLYLRISPTGAQYIWGTWSLGLTSASNGTTGAPLTAGAYVARDQYVQYETDYNTSSVTYGYTYGGASDSYTQTTQVIDEYALTPDGSRHYIGDGFNQSCAAQPLATCPSEPSGYPSGVISERYPATDASGYDENGHDANGLTYSSTAVSDPNGNSITSDSAGWTDTYGRNIPGSLTGPGTFPFPNSLYNPTTYVGDPIPGESVNVDNNCPSGTSGERQWLVPASTSYSSGEGAGVAAYYFCYTTFSYQTAFNIPSVLPTQSIPFGTILEATSNPEYGIGQALLLTAIILPDKNSYTFNYDSQYLSLTELTLPTGATISYTWQNVVFAPYPPLYTAPFVSPTPISRALLTRTVAPGYGQPSITTNYHWYITANPNGEDGGVQFPAYSVITDSNGNDQEFTLGGRDDAGTFWGGFVDLGVAYYSGCSPHDVATNRSCSPAQGTRMKSVTYALTGYASGGAAYGTPSYVPAPGTIGLTKVTQTTLHTPTPSGDILSRTKTNLVPNYNASCQVYSYPIYSGELCGQAPNQTLCQTAYNSCYSTGQTASDSFYDFGRPGSGSVGNLLKTESTKYQWQYNGGYLSANLLNQVHSSTTTGNSGNWVAETDFGYDESPSPSGYHGNQTSVTRYASPTSYVKSYTQYSASGGGVVTLRADSNGNQTAYSNFTCDGALPQSVTQAYGSTNTLPETTAYTYDCNIGKVLTVTDPNLQQTIFTWDDPFARITTAQYPDGGGVTVNYNGDGLPLTMTVTTLTGEPSGSSQTTTTYDGLARKTEAQVAASTSSASIIYTQTNYDTMGRISNVSNPSYSQSGLVFTTNSYDALSRQTKQTNPDNSFTQMCYNGIVSNGQTNCSFHLGNGALGTWVDSSDEIGNDWQRTSNALGQLIEVIEPNGTNPQPSMETYYSYDVLNNLLSVNQCGTRCPVSNARVRVFSYNALSWLITASNPESGTVGYGYDNNGNVLSKTDARGVVTSYAYDALNRMLSKTYANDASLTPSSCYQYDSSSIASSNAYLVGRLANQWTQRASAGTCAGSLPSSGVLSRRSVTAYDSMGRILHEQQCTPSNCASATSYAPTYTYDLAGRLQTWTNGIASTPSATVNPLMFTNAFDQAGRLQTLTSNWSDATTHPGTLFSARTGQSTPCPNSASTAYSPFGGLMNATFGTSLTLNRAYDVRFRPTCEIDMGSITPTPTRGSATVTVAGSEQTK